MRLPDGCSAIIRCDLGAPLSLCDAFRITRDTFTGKHEIIINYDRTALFTTLPIPHTYL